MTHTEQMPPISEEKIEFPPMSERDVPPIAEEPASISPFVAEPDAADAKPLPKRVKSKPVDLHPERVIPSDVTAEVSLLGALMLTGIEQSAERFDEIGEVLEGGDFYRPAHTEIYAAMCDLRRAGVPVEIITLRDSLFKRGTLENVGGIGYLLGLGEVVPTTANAVFHARIVAEKAQARRVIEAAARVAGVAYSDELTAKELAARAESEMATATHRTRAATDGKGWVSMGKATSSLWQSVDQRFHAKKSGDGGIIGLSSGLSELDAILGGLKPGELTILAARPSMGKSAKMGTLALNMGKSGHTVGIFSLEMSCEALTSRLAAAQSQVNGLYFQNGTLSEAEWERFGRAKEDLHDLPIYIDDSPDISVSQIRMRCRRLKQDAGQLDCIFVDYLGFMRCEPGTERMEKRDQIGESARALRNLAKEMECPVVLLAQLSRKCEMREDKRPIMSDLADSGSIEMHADVIDFLYRPSYYAKKEENKDRVPGRVDEVECIIAKNRNGPVGMVKLGYRDAFCQFVPLAEEVY